jgi:hypothetical protein
MQEDVRVLQSGMKKVVHHLLRMNTDFGSMDALEFGAKDGAGHAPVLVPHVRTYEAWEIDPANADLLQKNLASAKVVIGDGFELAKLRSIDKVGYDLIVFDCPQGVFGKDGQYCDHMEALELVNSLLKDKGLVIFNVKLKPYDYDNHPKWQQRRNAYYQMTDTAALTLEFAETFYSLLFQKMGMSVQNQFSVPRPQEPHLFYMVYELKRHCTSS